MNFNDYKYIPLIRTRASELLGVKELKDDTKSKILPFACLTKVNRNHSAKVALDKWVEAFKGNAVLGLAESQRLRVEEYDSMNSPDNDFEAWRSFCNEAKKLNEGFVPSLIYNGDIGKRDFVKQLQIFEGEFGKVALRVNPSKRRDIAAATTAASVIGDVQNILFYLDAGQVTRERQRAVLDASIFALNEIRSIDPSIDIVTCCTSFPRMFTSYCKDSNGRTGEIPMLEWENYHALGGNDFAIYGDYASIHGEFYEGSIAKFVARVDYPTPGMWFFERRPQKNKSISREDLYTDAANTIQTNEMWDDSLDAWGANVIRKATDSKLEKFGTPGKWISVRLNLHIERTLQFIEQGISFPTTESDDDWDEEDFDW